MPEETSQTPDQSVSANIPTPNKSNKTQLILIGILVTALIVVVGVAAYLWGSGAITKEKSVESPQVTKSQSKDIGKEYTANSGVTIVLEEAKLDANFEKKKKELREYLEIIATQSSKPIDEPESLKQNRLELKIAFKNKNEITATYNPGRFRLKDSDDRQYETEFDGDPLAINGVNSGETTKVNIYFTVPSNEKDFKLIYENVTINFSII